MPAGKPKIVNKKRSKYTRKKPVSINQQISKLQRQTQYLHTINGFAITLMDLQSVNEVYDFVVERIVNDLGFNHCVLYILNDIQHLEPVAFSSNQGGFDGYRLQDFQTREIGEGIVGNSAATASPIVVNDTEIDIRYIADIQPAQAEIAVPIIRNNKVLGVINCEHHEKNHFTIEHEQILATVAAIISTTLNSKQALTQLHETITKLEYAEKLQKALFSIASLTTHFDEISKFYETVHYIMSTLIYAENFYIALYDDHSSYLDFPYYIDEKTSSVPSDFIPREILDQSLTGWVFRNKQPLLASREEVYHLCEIGECSLYGEISESWLGVPFDSDQEIQGVVVVQSYNKAIKYTEKDKDILIFISQHISNALARVLNEKKFRHQALHDSLTGLPNRILLMDRITHAVDRFNRRNDALLAVMYLDLDRFKLVNDTLGHLMGDAFLIRVSEIMTYSIRDSDTLARLGGDEFAILLEDLPDKQAALDVAERIIHALEPPINIEGHELRTSASIGIAFSLNGQANSVDLLKQADTAMFKSKEGGRGIYHVFTPDMMFGNQNSLRLDIELKRAIEQEELELYYQPIFDLQTKKVVGVEALLRWNHPQRGLVFPGDFIEYAEETNLIVNIDRYVMQKAVQQLEQWKAELIPDLYMSVNLCGRSFGSPKFIEFILDLVKKAQINPGSLGVELTERALMSNKEATKKILQQLSNEQIKIFLDDFGTGYSSLSYLHQFTIHYLKIDRSFISTIEQGQFKNPFVKTIITLANTLNLQVVAEGIESKEQQQILQSLGCELGQGYVLSRPLAKEKVEQFLLTSDHTAH